MTDLDTLTSRTQRRRRELDGLAGEARAVLTRGKEIQAEISDLTDYISDYERVTVLLNSLGKRSSSRRRP